MSGLNAGLCSVGDRVLYCRAGGTYFAIVTNCGVYSLPSDTFYAEVNGKCVVDLPYYGMFYGFER